MVWAPGHSPLHARDSRSTSSLIPPLPESLRLRALPALSRHGPARKCQNQVFGSQSML